VCCGGAFNSTGSTNSSIVGVYLIGQAAETIILWGISDRTGSRNSNIVGIFLIGQAVETEVLWGNIL